VAKINLQDGEIARLQITKAQEAEITNLYHQTYLNLKKQMNSIPKNGTPSDSMRRSYLKKLTSQLKESYQSMRGDLEKSIKDGMLATSQAVVDANDVWLQKAGITLQGAYSYVPKDIVSLISTGKIYGGNWTLSKAIWGHTQKTLNDIDQVVATGVAVNKSAYEIAKDLEQYVNPSARKEWEWSKVYPGTSKKVDYNAQRLARTMVSHAYQQSLLATTKYNPFVKGYRWRSAHSSRTCEICNERDGKLYSADDLPLDHPNGLCTFIAELSDNMSDIADRIGDWATGSKDSALDQWYDSMRRNPSK
jgi:SPP1 gp7 family putative phage head morphogenesis protein